MRFSRIFLSLHGIAVFSVSAANAGALTDYEIVFSSDRSGYLEIYKMNGDGSGVVQLTDQKSDMPDYDPRWIRGTSEISFQSYRRGGWRTWKMDESGDNAHRFLDYPTYEGKADWSPTEDRIVFTSYRPAMNLYLADKSGKVLKQLTYNEGYKVITDHGRWSPDGNEIVYVSNMDGDY